MLDRTDVKAEQCEAFRRDVLAGLGRSPKTLPSRWLYDARGSELFEEITTAPEYYPTRTERTLLEANRDEIADFFGPAAVLIEYGAGASIKTEIVLGALHDPALYVPIDIAGDFLDDSARRIRTLFPDLDVDPVIADFTEEFDLPGDLPRDGRGAFFPGSTIGNLDEAEATAFLRRMHSHLGGSGVAVIGADLKKDVGVLERAYDDAAGITAAFNRNILTRAERELGARVQIEAFRHEARWNDEASAMEMHLVADRPCEIVVDDEIFRFEAGETIHTESSRKYDIAALEQLAEAGGFKLERLWRDQGNLFAVAGLRAIG